MSQYQIQSWRGLPDHFKRQAAPDMLAGKTWMFYGKQVENPGPDELRRRAVVESVASKGEGK